MEAEIEKILPKDKGETSWQREKLPKFKHYGVVGVPGDCHDSDLSVYVDLEATGVGNWRLDQICIYVMGRS